MRTQCARHEPRVLVSATFDRVCLSVATQPPTVKPVIGCAITRFEPQLTLNVINITGEERRSNFYYDNAVNDVYDPGTTVMLGIRGSF